MLIYMPGTILSLTVLLSFILVTEVQRKFKADKSPMFHYLICKCI